MRVAILEDDHTIADHLKGLVTGEGHDAIHFADATTFLEAFDDDPVDLLLVDWELPDISGRDVITKLRTEVETQIPVIMITARTDASDIIAGLACGADDFISKPVVDTVLRARIEAVVRRTHGVKKASLEEYGLYSFDTLRREITWNGARLITTDKEFALSRLLFRNFGRPLSRDYIIESVWGHDPSSSSRTLDVHISHIRTNLGLTPERGLRLSAIMGFGYRLEDTGLQRVGVMGTAQEKNETC